MVAYSLHAKYSNTSEPTLFGTYNSSWSYSFPKTSHKKNGPENVTIYKSDFHPTATLPPKKSSEKKNPWKKTHARVASWDPPPASGQ